MTVAALAAVCALNAARADAPANQWTMTWYRSSPTNTPPAGVDVALWQDFETVWTASNTPAGGDPSSGWSKLIMSNNTDWVRATNGLNNGSGPGYPPRAWDATRLLSWQNPITGTSNYIARYGAGSYGNVTRLISPRIDLSGYMWATMSFWHVQVPWPADQDYLSVWIHTNPTPDQLYNKYRSGGWQRFRLYTAGQTNWIERDFGLTNIAFTTNMYIAFEGWGEYAYGTCMDDLIVYGSTVSQTYVTVTSLWQDFETVWTASNTPAGGYPSSGWSKLIMSNNTDWVRATNGLNNGIGPGYPPRARTNAWVNPVTGTSNYFARYGAGSYGNVTRLFTPGIDLSGYNNATLSFWHIQVPWPADQDYLGVWVHTNATAAALTNRIRSGGWQRIAYYNASVTNWTLRSLALTNVGPNTVIALEGIGEYAYGVMVDDLQITSLEEYSPLGSIKIVPGSLSYAATYGGGNPAVQTFVITNTGDASLDWSGSIAYGGGANGWFVPSSTSSALAAGGAVPLTGTVSITGISAGTYYATNTITSVAADNSPQELVVQLTVGKGTAGVYLQDLLQIYNGAARNVTATSDPSGLTVEFTYDGSETAPTAVGSYAVTGTVVEANWQGEATGTLVILPITNSLTVGSLHGSPAPATGTTWHIQGSWIDAFVDAPILSADMATQHVCTGWSGAGSVPEQGTSNAVSFTITNNSTLVWNWRTEYDLTINPDINGSVNLPNGWYVAFTNLSITATPTYGYEFTDWTGDIVTNANPLNLTMDRAYNLTPVFTRITNSLMVSSLYGTPTPATGTTWHFQGAQIDAFVDSNVLSPDMATQQVCVGWSGTGSVPEQGTSNAVSFTITNNSTLVWNWSTEYDLTINPDINGSVNLPNGWYVAFTNLSIIATPINGYEFTGWTGDIVTNANPLNLVMDRAYNLTPVFKASQTIADFLPTNGSVFAENEVACLSASASSGLPVVFVTNYGPGVISDGTNLSFTGYGEVAVVASQSGNANWSAAAEVTNIYTVLGLFEVTVESAYGTTVPVTGVYTMLVDSVFTNQVQTPDTRGTTQYVSGGWVTTGSLAPAGGAGTQAVVTVTGDGTLTWLWTTNYWLDTAAGPHGSVNAGDQWLRTGVITQITATADQYYYFTNWSGNVSGGEAFTNPLDLLMDMSKAVTAHFEAQLTTNSGTPYWWMAEYGITQNFEAVAMQDLNSNGYSTAEDYIIGLDPTNPASVFRPEESLIYGTNCCDVVWTNDDPYMVGTQVICDVAGMLISWPSVSGRVYDIEAGQNLPGFDWSGLAGGLNVTATPPMNIFTNPVAQMTNNWQFYRHRIRLDP